MSSTRPSMTDVATRAGVSYQTVSRVLNTPEKVKESTRSRVERVIAELGYTPNRAARTLRTTQSSIIGVVTDGSPLFGPAATLGAVEQAANAAGFATLLTSVSQAMDSRRAGDQLIELGVDGIIVIAPHDQMITPLRAIGGRVPVIAVAAESFDIEGVSYVAVNQAEGARMAVRHLHERGARSVLHIQGPESWFDARVRARGFAEVAGKLGLDVRVTDPVSWDASDGYRLIKDLPSKEVPDAVFAANDLLALGAIRALTERGVSVPGDVMVIGFDDMAGAEFFHSGLSTLRQPFTELGRMAVEVLLARVGGAEAPHVTALQPELQVRGSTVSV